MQFSCRLHHQSVLARSRRTSTERATGLPFLPLRSPPRPRPRPFLVCLSYIVHFARKCPPDSFFPLFFLFLLLLWIFTALSFPLFPPRSATSRRSDYEAWIFGNETLQARTLISLNFISITLFTLREFFFNLEINGQNIYMKFKIEGFCDGDALVSFTILSPFIRECFLRPLFFSYSVSFPFCSFPRLYLSVFAGCGTQTFGISRYIRAPKARNSRDLGPDIACVYSSSSSSLLPSCVLPTKILRGLSAYAFVTCVSHRHRRRRHGPPILDGETKSITTQGSRASFLN